MKQIFCAILAIVIAAMPLAARDRISRNASELPTIAQTMLSTHFKKADINRIKISTKAFGKKEYEVILNNGTEIEFNHDGVWTEIDCGRNEVPSELVLNSIRQYVKDNFKKAGKIVKISSEHNRYEIELYDGTELIFSRSGKFLRIDD